MPTRLLLVEDEPVIRMDLRDELQRMGYQIVGEAGDGRTGVALARELRPDLVIMCIVLPEMDGLTAAHILYTERIAPVMLLTALCDDEMVARACAAGVVMYLTKPWRQSEIRAAIEVALARHREITALEERVHTLEQQLATRRMVERAKGLLMEVEHLSEGEAFRRIQRLAMNHRAPMREVGEAILVAYDAVWSQLGTRMPTDAATSEEANRRVVQVLDLRRAARAEHPPLPPRPPLPPAPQHLAMPAVPEAPLERIQAEQRAEALLNEYLTEEQRNQLAHEGFVEVPSTLIAGRSYRIPRTGRFPTVLEHGIPVCRLCVGPVERLPSADLVLCHLLLIATDEQRYLAIANRVAL